MKAFEKEKEMSVRIRLQEETKKARNHLENIMEVMVESDHTDKTVINNIKRVLDELSIFDTELDLSEAGDHRSLSAGALVKLRQYEREFIDPMENTTKTAEIIERKVINGEEFDINKELLMLRQYITKARNGYRNRIEYIKGIKG